MYNKNYSKYLHWMMNLVAHLPKYPVYTFWYYACIKQTEMVQQSIYSLKTDNLQFHKSYLIQP